MTCPLRGAEATANTVSPMALPCFNIIPSCHPCDESTVLHHVIAVAPFMLAYCCTIFLGHLGMEIDDRHRNPNINIRDHLVGQSTTLMPIEQYRTIKPCLPNFNGLNSTLPHCAPQVLVIFTRRGKASFFRDGADLFIPDIHSGSGQL